ncbi:hypothetical protein [Aliikangiella sp. G2MR2-5]|uniref:hypothetical protein n=1 Tax=Aliikangiella sp. G2MR2-5 TaxID=2788943 RepID=UPI0018AB98E4|nr:hypothetical protein [Aliikangiella sp. G2MR2-5]
MKVAARFPIKESFELKYFLLAFHLALLVVAVVAEIHWSWRFAAILSVFLSYYFSNKNYLRITRAPDDLCWTGESWLMRGYSQSQDSRYLDLIGDSWISGVASLLHFDDGTHRHYWFFSKVSLGARAYSELVYYARQYLKEKSIAEK